MELLIRDRRVGGDEPVFVVAELSANHNRSFDLAVETIRAARDAGADAVKLQTYTAETITIDADNEYFRIDHGTIWDGKTLYELYREAYTPWEWQPKLKETAEDLGLVCFSTPFDRTAVDFLESMDVPAYKVASFEITDIPLIEYIASKGKPVIISTGIAGPCEVWEAVEACRRAGNDRIALMKCTSAYPAPPEEANLRTIANMADTFGTVVGLSDHTPGTATPVAAVALGARIIEKHLILDRGLGGPDAPFSLEPSEFRSMVDSVREAQKAVGGISYEPPPSAVKNRRFRRSLFVVRDVGPGEELTEENVRSIRPGFGLPPKYMRDVTGRKFRRSVRRGTPLSWDMLE